MTLKLKKESVLKLGGPTNCYENADSGSCCSCACMRPPFVAKVAAVLVILALAAFSGKASAADPEGWKVRCDVTGGNCEIYWG